MRRFAHVFINARGSFETKDQIMVALQMFETQEDNGSY